MTGQISIVMRRLEAGAIDAARAREAPMMDYMLLSDLLPAEICSASNYDPAQHSIVGRWLARRSVGWEAALSAFRQRKTTRAYYCVSEDLAFRLAFLLGPTHWGGKVHTVVHASQSWRRKQLMRWLGRRLLGQVFTDSDCQKEHLMAGAGLAERSISTYFNPVDADYFDPALARPLDTDRYIFSCGLENRDYATLEAVAELSPYPFRVQASGYFPNLSRPAQNLPSNYTVSRTKVAFNDLRNAYAGSRFVIVPLNDVPYAAGVTGMVEAMLMGKAVIVTRTEGLTEYFDACPSIITVPARDAMALKAETERLWNDPQLCAKLGAANQAWAREHACLKAFCQRVAETLGAPEPFTSRQANEDRPALHADLRQTTR